jgi:hypothetical protein
MEQFFFAPTDAASLNLFRLLYCGALAGVHFPQLSRVESLYTNAFSVYFPTPLFDWLGLTQLPLGVVRFAGILLLVTLVSAAVGLFTRTALTLAWISFFLFYGTVLGFEKPYPNVISLYTYHYNNIVLFVLGILSVSPGIALWGIDGWRRRQWVWSLPPNSRPSLSTVPLWPTRLIILTLALAYFGSGFTKLKSSGVLWADGYTLQGYFLMKHLQEEAWAGYWLSQYYWVCVGVSICTLALELSFVIVPFISQKRWVLWCYVGAGLGFHALIHLTMRITHFLPFMGLTYLIFLDWPTVQRIGRWLGMRTGKQQEPEEETPRAGRLPLDEGKEGMPWQKGLAWAFCLGLPAGLLLCIAGDIERWPFSAYGVFRERFHYKQVQVGQLRGVDGQQERRWLKAQDLGSGFDGWFDGADFVRFYIARTGRAAATKEGSWTQDFLREGPRILRDFRALLPAPLRAQWHDLEFVVRSVRQDQAGWLVVVDQVLLSTASPSPQEERSTTTSTSHPEPSRAERFGNSH